MAALLRAQSVVTPTIVSGGDGNTTIGQPVAGETTDGTLQLEAGFWFPWPASDLVVAKSHADSFDRGDSDREYTITVSNRGQKATSGEVKVVDTLPAGLTATSMSGSGWSCELAALTCTRSDALAVDENYPAITLTVSVANDAASSLVNKATVSGGSQWRTSNDVAFDATTIRSATTTTLSSSPNPSTDGSAADFTAAVHAAAGTPSGAVTFKRGLETLGIALVIDGEATLAISTLPVGSHEISAEYTGDDTYADSVATATHIVNPVAAPSSFSATATSETSIALTWNAVPDATSYEIDRRLANGTYAQIDATTNLTATDGNRTADTTYLYRVRAIGPSAPSDYSAVDWATTTIFTDSESLAGVSIKAVHVTELRRAVNAMRRAAGLDPLPFSDPAPAAGGPIRAIHVSELRAALDEARSTLELAAIPYAEPAINAGATIRAAHFEELRQGVR